MTTKRQAARAEWPAIALGAALLAAIASPGVIVRAIQAPDGEVTFARDVAPIIFDHCGMCHHPGGSAPFSLLTYPAVVERSEEHTSELQSLTNLVCRLLLEKKKKNVNHQRAG